MDYSVLIRQLQNGVGGLRLRAGVESIGTTASVFGSATVTHGLDDTPLVVVATAAGTTGVVNVTVSNFTASSFDAHVRYTDDVARTTSQDVYWLAIWG